MQYAIIRLYRGLGGKDYEIVITATNTLGEAKKEESKIVVIEVPKGKTLLFYSDVRF